MVMIKKWWEKSAVISDTQGAYNKGVLLQETLVVQLGNGSNACIVYLDVSKAFNSIWIDSLFDHFYLFVIKGKLWQLLYKWY